MPGIFMEFWGIVFKKLSRSNLYPGQIRKMITWFLEKTSVNRQVTEEKI